MRSLLNLRTRAKLLLGFGVMTLFLTTVVVAAYGNLKAVVERYRV